VIEREFPDGSRIVSSVFPDGATELILELDGQKVSRVVIVPMLMRLGAAVVKMDGIGGVETEEVFRNQGYSRRVMEMAVEMMQAGGAALSTLFGIEDFYPKFGYVTIGAEWTVTLPLREIGKSTVSLPNGWSVRDFRADDLPAVMRLYHLNTRHSAGALFRHDEADELEENAALAQASPLACQIGRRAWKKLENVVAEPDKDACRVVLDTSGEIASYAWLGRPNWWMGVRYEYEPNAFHFAEVMASGSIAADAVLAACRQWATEAGNVPGEIRIAIPPEGPVANAAAYEGGTFVGLHTRDGNFMGRVLDVRRLLDQMRPELAARARACRLGFEGDLVFATDAGEATLSIGRDSVATGAESGGARVVVELPQEALARLCVGAFEPQDVLARLPRTLDRRIGMLLSALFPRRAPHIYPLDRF
jgi:Acetyltransferase (GNAT) domain